MNVIFHISVLLFKNKHPKIIITEINIIIGLSLTKVLNNIREIAYKNDCITVVLKEYFFKLLNIEKAKKLLIKYLITSINIRSKLKSLPYHIHKIIKNIIKIKITKRYINR